MKGVPVPMEGQKRVTFLSKMVCKRGHKRVRFEPQGGTALLKIELHQFDVPKHNKTKKSVQLLTGATRVVNFQYFVHSWTGIPKGVIGNH